MISFTQYYYLKENEEITKSDVQQEIEKLRELQKHNPEEFKKLYNQAVELIKKKGLQKESSIEEICDIINEEYLLEFEFKKTAVTLAVLASIILGSTGNALGKGIKHTSDYHLPSYQEISQNITDNDIQIPDIVKKLKKMDVFSQDDIKDINNKTIQLYKSITGDEDDNYEYNEDGLIDGNPLLYLIRNFGENIYGKSIHGKQVKSMELKVKNNKQNNIDYENFIWRSFFNIMRNVEEKYSDYFSKARNYKQCCEIINILFSPDSKNPFCNDYKEDMPKTIQEMIHTYILPIINKKGANIHNFNSQVHFTEFEPYKQYMKDKTANKMIAQK